MRLSKFSLIIALVVAFSVGVGAGCFFTNNFLSKIRHPSTIAPAELFAEAAIIGQGELDWLDSMKRLAALQDRLRNLDAATLAAVMTATTLPPNSDVGIQLVAATLAEKEPQLAWDLALSIKSPDAREGALKAVISTIASKDPSHALKLSMNLPEGEGSDVTTIFNHWARIDMEGAKTAAEHLSGHAGEQARRALVSSLVRKDPQAAWNYALALPRSPNDGQDVRVEIIQTWAQSDPQSAFKAAISIPELEPRGSAISAAVGAWSLKDFSGALQYAISIQDSKLRANVLSVLSNTASENRKELLDAMLAYMPPGDHFYNTLTSFLHSWAVTNPDELASIVTQLPAGRTFADVPREIALRWMEMGRNTQEVFDWVRQLPEGTARLSAFDSVLKEWSSNNPQEALKTLNSLEPKDRKQAVRALACGWSRKDPQAVLQWASMSPDAEEHREIVKVAIFQWTDSSPESAIQYIERLPQEDRDAAMQIAMNGWAARDTNAAAEWLRSQPSSASKDAAIILLSQKISEEDPKRALDLASTISDAPRRANQIESLARGWLQQDATTARAWISKSKLPEETRKRLLE